MKTLFLQRHCTPVAGHPMDATRQLTDAGRKQAAQMAAFLVADIGRVDIVISSPFARAIETAEIMADALGSYVTTTTMLEPDAKPEDAWAEIERLGQQSQDVLIVGHDPSINLLLAWLINGGSIRFEWGAIAHVSQKTMHRGTHDQVVARLHWFVDPELVGKEAEDKEILEASRAVVEALEVPLREGWVTIDGHPLFIGGEDSTKAEIARKNYVPANGKEQRIADEAEKELAKGLGLDRTPDNSPFDLKTGKVAVEVKTLISNKNDKITMSKDARARKLTEAAGPPKLRTYTVVADKRTPGATKYYYSGGVGSFRLGSMQQASSMKDLAKRIV